MDRKKEGKREGKEAYALWQGGCHQPQSRLPAAAAAVGSAVAAAAAVLIHPPD